MQNRSVLFSVCGVVITVLVLQGSISVFAQPQQEASQLYQPTIVQDPPSSFDLRDVEGENFVTGVRDQGGFGTCWTFGTMASLESNLLMTDEWSINNEEGEPDLSEAHLDWWNGFNTHNNEDDPGGAGLSPHYGGDYRVSSAYMTRGEGTIRESDAPYEDLLIPPDQYHKKYHYYYPREIVWMVAEPDLSNIGMIKTMIMAYGAVGTCMCVKGSFFDGIVHYQPPESDLDPNHAIAIIGWDDTMTHTQAPHPGAWLCKNSWGADWGDNGFFWISYYDKHCGQHPEMGAVSYQHVKLIENTYFYHHDYHGWRDTLGEVQEAFNAFTVENEETMTAVSFYTAEDAVVYTLVIYDDYEAGALQNMLATQTGTIEYEGYHTIDLDEPLELPVGDDFYVYLNLSQGGHPIDRTSEIPVLLGLRGATVVISEANPGESYYKSGENWVDLYDYGFVDPEWNHTANFCMKVITHVKTPVFEVSEVSGGLGRLTASVKNIGEARGVDINCNIKITGGILGRIDIDSDDILESLAVGDIASIASRQLVLGMGKVDITIAVDYQTKWTGTGYVIGLLLIGVQEN